MDEDLPSFASHRSARWQTSVQICMHNHQMRVSTCNVEPQHMDSTGARAGEVLVV